MPNESTLNGAQLLKTYNPVLVLHAQDPKLTWPGASEPGMNGWGDYHPCSAEFLLDRVCLRKEQPPFRPFRWGWKRSERTGLDVIKQDVAALANPHDSREWELDISDLPSQTEKRAWEEYGKLLEEANPPHPYRRVAYGRFVPGSPDILQYWYLYVYNDFFNNHEADWEMAAIELGDDGTPRRVGLSGHFGGAQRDWKDVRKIDGKPVVYVARGSHAGYFEYRPGGFTAEDLVVRSNLPAVVGVFVSAFRWVRLLRKVTDWPPADRDFDPAPPEHHGGAESPDLVSLDSSGEGGAAPWWLSYRGKWGSTRPRWFGAVGIDSPWASDPRDKRWKDPQAWLKSLTPSRPGR